MSRHPNTPSFRGTNGWWLNTPIGETGVWGWEFVPFHNVVNNDNNDNNDHNDNNAINNAINNNDNNAINNAINDSGDEYGDEFAEQQLKAMEAMKALKKPSMVVKKPSMMAKKPSMKAMKVMKVMKKKLVSKIAKGNNSCAVVMRGNQEKTATGMTKAEPA